MNDLNIDGNKKEVNPPTPTGNINSLMYWPSIINIQLNLLRYVPEGTLISAVVPKLI